jgi:hypothetical protein
VKSYFSRAFDLGSATEPVVDLARTSVQPGAPALLSIRQDGHDGPRLVAIHSRRVVRCDVSFRGRRLDRGNADTSTSAPVTGSDAASDACRRSKNRSRRERRRNRRPREK